MQLENDKTGYKTFYRTEIMPIYEQQHRKLSQDFASTPFQSSTPLEPPPQSERLGSVGDNVKMFNGSRRHSSFDAPQMSRGRPFRTNTLNRTAPSPQLSSPQTNTPPKPMNRATSLSSLIMSDGVRPERDPNENAEVNSNVPWRNHFSKLRRKSGSAQAYSSPAYRGILASAPPPNVRDSAL